MLPEKYQNLLDSPLVANIVIQTESDYPHVTPVWYVEYNSLIYFSTHMTRKKFKLIQKTKKISFTIVHPSGGPYFTANTISRIKRKEEFAHYNQIVDKIMHRYIEDEERAKEACKTNLADPQRVLVEMEIKNFYGN